MNSLMNSLIQGPIRAMITHTIIATRIMINAYSTIPCPDSLGSEGTYPALLSEMKFNDLENLDNLNFFLLFFTRMVYLII